MSDAPSPEPRKLRVGLLLDSFTLAAWEMRMVQRIATAEFANLALVVLTAPERLPNTPRRRTPGHAVRAVLDRAYRYWEARYPCEPDAFAKRDARDLLAGVPVLRTGTRSSTAVRTAVTAFGSGHLVSTPHLNFA